MSSSTLQLNEKVYDYLLGHSLRESAACQQLREETKPIKMGMMERTRAARPDIPDDYYLQPDDIAQSVYELTCQHRSAWTFELDLRPFGEQW